MKPLNEMKPDHRSCIPWRTTVSLIAPNGSQQFRGEIDSTATTCLQLPHLPQALNMPLQKVHFWEQEWILMAQKSIEFQRWLLHIVATISICYGFFFYMRLILCLEKISGWRVTHPLQCVQPESTAGSCWYHAVRPLEKQNGLNDIITRRFCSVLLCWEIQGGRNSWYFKLQEVNQLSGAYGVCEFRVAAVQWTVVAYHSMCMHNCLPNWRLNP